VRSRLLRCWLIYVVCYVGYVALLIYVWLRCCYVVTLFDCCLVVVVVCLLLLLLRLRLRLICYVYVVVVDLLLRYVG